MSKKIKRAKLGKVQEEIRGVLAKLEQIENEHSELYEAAEILEIELLDLHQEEKKILKKLS